MKLQRFILCKRVVALLSLPEVAILFFLNMSHTNSLTDFDVIASPDMCPLYHAQGSWCYILSRYIVVILKLSKMLMFYPPSICAHIIRLLVDFHPSHICHYSISPRDFYIISILNICSSNTPSYATHLPLSYMPLCFHSQRCRWVIPPKYMSIISLPDISLLYPSQRCWCFIPSRYFTVLSLPGSVAILSLRDKSWFKSNLIYPSSTFP